jgi:hypothetical protein
MTSPSPSPSALVFADTCLFDNVSEAEARKRPPSPLVLPVPLKKIVAETLLPDTIDATPRKRREPDEYRSDADVGPSAQARHNIQESVVVPASQQHSESDGSEDDACAAEDAGSASQTISTDWTAGNRVSLCLFLRFVLTCISQCHTRMAPTPSTLIGMQLRRTLHGHF